MPTLNSLADVAVTVGIKPAADLSKAHAADVKSVAQFQARMLDRHARIIRKIGAWDRDELTDRYAWLLLLALTMRGTERATDRSRHATDEILQKQALLSHAYHNVALQLAGDLARHHRDRVGAAAAKLARDRDGTQAAKAQARKLWDERHAGKHPQLRTNEQFATECMRRWPALKSVKVILGWCTKWNKASKGRETQPVS